MSKQKKNSGIDVSSGQLLFVSMGGGLNILLFVSVGSGLNIQACYC